MSEFRMALATDYRVPEHYAFRIFRGALYIYIKCAEKSLTKHTECQMCLN